MRIADILLYMAFFLPLVSCDLTDSGNGGNSSCYGYPYNTKFTGIISDTSGHILRHFPITDSMGDTYQMLQRKFNDMKGDWVGATARSGATVIDPVSGRLIFNTEPHFPYDASRHSDDLFFVRNKEGTFHFNEDITLYPKVETAAMRLNISASGDTSSSRLFSLRIQKIDSTRFENYRILRIEPMAADSFLYVANYEITSVRWDSTGENVHRNRYYFERSLWSYNETTGEHTKLLKLPKPEHEQELREWDVTPDGRFAAYRDGWEVYLVDLTRKALKKINRADDESLENPIISRDGDYVLTSNGYGKFKVYDRSSGDSWLAISRQRHDILGFPAFSPSNQYIYYANNFVDTTGIKRVQTLRHYYNNSENREGGRWITRIDTLFNIPKDKRSEIDLGQPYFINPNRFMIIANFKNIFDFNDECI